tara:strand:- start:1433 stop:1648 length:216 start_codon:yes stop_codon:yes gene_type:complete
MANELSEIDIRLECLRLAVEFGTQRDMLHPSKLADIYYEWVMQGSSETSPQDNRKDDSLKLAQKTRSVRKG